MDTSSQVATMHACKLGVTICTQELPLCSNVCMQGACTPDAASVVLHNSFPRRQPYSATAKAKHQKQARTSLRSEAIQAMQPGQRRLVVQGQKAQMHFRQQHYTRQRQQEEHQGLWQPGMPLQHFFQPAGLSNPEGAGPQNLTDLMRYADPNQLLAAYVARMQSAEGSPTGVLCCVCCVCCAVLCCAVLCCAVLCCAVLCCAVLCSQKMFVEERPLHRKQGPQLSTLLCPCTLCLMAISVLDAFTIKTMLPQSCRSMPHYSLVLQDRPRADCIFHAEENAPRLVILEALHV
jgi:hypothetical protein